jgi:hypothetical protein
MNPMKIHFIIILLLMSFTGCYSQASPEETTDQERISAGIGGGLNYGGFGASLLVYPHRNIGMFVGVGYALAGMGSNVGVKVKIKEGPKISPYVLGMYGYNAAIKVKGASQYNRMFYGPSFGLGMDLKSKRQKKNYFSFALLIPVRSPDVDDYIDALKSTGGISFKNNLIPIGFSVGYQIIIK